MRDGKRIKVFRFGRVSQFGKTAVKQHQLKAQMIDKRDGNTKAHAKILLSHQSPR